MTTDERGHVLSVTFVAHFGDDGYCYSLDGFFSDATDPNEPFCSSEFVRGTPTRLFFDAAHDCFNAIRVRNGPVERKVKFVGHYDEDKVFGDMCFYYGGDESPEDRFVISDLREDEPMFMLAHVALAYFQSLSEI